MSLLRNKLLKAMVDFVNDPGTIKLVVDGDLSKIARLVSTAERLITDGFSVHPNLLKDPKRPCQIGRLIFAGLTDVIGEARQNRIENIRIYLSSIINYASLVRGKSNINIGENFNLEFLPDVDYYFWRNVSTSHTRYWLELKRYIANNHILDLAMEDPLLFVGPMLDAINATATKLPKRINLKFGLENQADNMPKVDDGMFVLDIPNLIFKISGKEVDVGAIKVFLTIDSKFLVDINNIGSAKTIKQQMLIALGERAEQSLIPVLNSINFKALSIEDKAKLIDQLFPIIFHHQILRPKDIDNLTPYMKNKYGDEFISYAKYHLEPYLEANEVGDEVFDLVMAGIRKHADEYYRKGKFINNSSKMLYKDN